MAFAAPSAPVSAMPTWLMYQPDPFAMATNSSSSPPTPPLRRRRPTVLPPPNSPTLNAPADSSHDFDIVAMESLNIGSPAVVITHEFPSATSSPDTGAHPTEHFGMMPPGKHHHRALSSLMAPVHLGAPPTASTHTLAPPAFTPALLSPAGTAPSSPGRDARRASWDSAVDFGSRAHSRAPSVLFPPCAAPEDVWERPLVMQVTSDEEDECAMPPPPPATPKLKKLMLAPPPSPELCGGRLLACPVPPPPMVPLATYEASFNAHFYARLDEVRREPDALGLRSA